MERRTRVKEMVRRRGAGVMRKKKRGKLTRMRKGDWKMVHLHSHRMGEMLRGFKKTSPHMTSWRISGGAGGGVMKEEDTSGR